MANNVFGGFSEATDSAYSVHDQRRMAFECDAQAIKDLELWKFFRQWNPTTEKWEGSIALDAVTESLTIGTQANVTGSGTALTASLTGAVRVFSDDGGASLDAADSVRGVQSRLLLTVAQTGCSIRALQGQLKMPTGLTVASGIYTASQAYVELVGTLGVNSGATFSCLDASLELGGVMTVASGGEAYGIHVETTGAGTITNNGTCAAIGITKASGAASWPVGLLVGSSTTGVEIGDATTGILLSGTCTTGISITGTTTTAISLAGTFSGHGIQVAASSAFGDNKAIYIGAWGSEATFNDGGGLFRIYGQVGAGGTASALTFIRANTASTSGIIAAQFYADSDATTPGPTVLSGVDAFAILNAGKYLAASVGATDGMHAMWAKVNADTTSVCNGNVCALWVDNQMHCAVGGWEAGVFLTTGGSVPDSAFRFNTSSSGWTNLFTFDSTMTGKAPIGAAVDTNGNDSDISLIMEYNNTTYYIPAFVAAKLA